jgi:predicted kinase
MKTSAIPARKPQLILLHGYIGAGKTTLALALARTLPALRLSIDEWMVDLFGSDPDEKKFNEWHSATLALMHKVANQSLIAGQSVILDCGHWDTAATQRLIDHIKSTDSSQLLISLACTPEVAWGRTKERNQSTGSTSLYIDKNTFDSLRDRYTPNLSELDIPILSIDTTKLSSDEVFAQVIDLIT